MPGTLGRRTFLAMTALAASAPLLPRAHARDCGVLRTWGNCVGTPLRGGAILIEGMSGGAMPFEIGELERMHCATIPPGEGRMAC